MIAFLFGIVVGGALYKAHRYLDTLRGDLFCAAWPRCWKRATHYIVRGPEVDMCDGWCQRHADMEAVEQIASGFEDVSVCDLKEAQNHITTWFTIHGDED